jgi:hypothetical protein
MPTTDPTPPLTWTRKPPDRPGRYRWASDRWAEIEVEIKDHHGRLWVQSMDRGAWDWLDEFLAYHPRSKWKPIPEPDEARDAD